MVVVFVWPEFAFNYLMSIATIAGIINWTMIMLTEMKFRKVVAAGGAPEDSELAGLSGQEALDAIHFKLPFAKVTPWVVLAFLALVVVLMCFSTSYRRRHRRRDLAGHPLRRLPAHSGEEVRLHLRIALTDEHSVRAIRKLSLIHI